MRTIIKNLINDMNMRDVLANSYKSFHAKGFNYINLLRTRKLTIKLYMTLMNNTKPNEDGFLINPHSHNYNFQTYVMQGGVEHYVFKEVEGSKWNRFDYKTGLNGGEAQFVLRDRCNLDLTEKRYFGEGHDYYLEDSEIHTIVIPKDMSTCLLLFQYQDKPKNSTLYFSREIIPPNTEGLYQKFTEPEVMFLLESFDLI